MFVFGEFQGEQIHSCQKTEQMEMEIGMKMVLFWGGIFVAQYICLNPEGGKSMSYFVLYMGVSKNRDTPKWMI